MMEQDQDCYDVSPQSKIKVEEISLDGPLELTQTSKTMPLQLNKIQVDEDQQKKAEEKAKQETQKRHEQELLFSAAFIERKTMNLNKIKQYMGRRVSSYQQRSTIFETLRQKLYEKQKLSKKAIESIIKYFTEYQALLKYLHKSLTTKLELKKKYQNFQTLSSIKDAITELVDLNDDESAHLEKFIDWINKILIQALKASNEFYKDRVKKISKDLEKYDHQYYSCFDKEQKFYEKLSDGNDLLEKELGLIQKLKLTDEALIERGVHIYEAWETFLEEEKTLKKLLKQNILQFYEEYIKFLKKIESARNLHKFWSNLQGSPNPETVFHSILSEKEVKFILYEDQIPGPSIQKQPTQNKGPIQTKTESISAEKAAKQKKEQIARLTKGFQNFLRLKYQENRIGSPYPFLQILVVKKFQSKIQKNSRDWKDIRLIFTVDHNLLLFNETNGKCLLKLMERSLKLKRISENILELTGVQVGFVFDSTKRQIIHFDTLDKVEEFIYFVDGMIQKPQIK